MAKLILTVAALSSLSLGCGKRSARESYQRASDRLEIVASICSAVSEAATTDGQTRTESLPIGTRGHKADPDNAVLTRLLVAFSAGYDAKRCAEARDMLRNFAAQEELNEKPTPEAFDKLIVLLEELSKSVDNLVTNPNLIKETPAVERVQLRKLPPLIKEAHDLVIAHRPSRS